MFRIKLLAASLLGKISGVRYAIAAATLLFAAQPLVMYAQTTWYVATNGTDSNACSSTSAPCLSFNAAYQKASGGDYVQVAAGSYGSQTFTSSSKATDVVFRPATGASVTVGSVNFNGSPHIELRDMTISEWQNQLKASYITLRNVTIKGGVFILGGSNLSMIGGSVGPGVDYHPQIAPSNGWQGEGVNILFDGVLFHDWTRSSTTVHTECLQVAGTTNMIIRNSKFTNCAVFDLSFTEYNSSGKVSNLLLENNWFDTAVSGGYYSVHLSAMSGGTVRYNSASQAMFVDTTGTNSGTLNILGNNIVGGLLDGISGGCLGSAMAGSYSYNVTQGWKCSSTDVNAAPGFANAGGFDFHLVSTAVAKDFVPISAGAPARDIDGIARPQGSGFDAGASELMSTSGTLPSAPTGLQVTVK